MIEYRITFGDGTVLVTTQFYRRMPDGYLRPIKFEHLQLDSRYWAKRPGHGYEQLTFTCSVEVNKYQEV